MTSELFLSHRSIILMACIAFASYSRGVVDVLIGQRCSLWPKIPPVAQISIIN